MATDTRKMFYTTEKLGEKRELTPEGFLLCRDVAIARTGEMLYGPGETPIDPGPDGVTRIQRYPEDVFRDITIASFNGKPVVNNHPDEGVVPENWNDLAVGVVLNPRREGDLLIADLLVTNPQAIQDVNEGKREVSCGYDTSYVKTGEGRGRQTNIIGNHVALVEQGRCGQRCAIKDHAAKNLTGDKQVKKTWDQAWQGIKAKLSTAFKANDEAGFTAALDSIKVTKDDGEQVHVHFPEGAQDSGYTKDEINAMIAEQNGKHAASDSRHSAHDSDIAGLNTKVDKMAADMAPLLPGMVGDSVPCSHCNGTGKDDGKDCEYCDGTGKANKNPGDEMPDKELENEAPAGTGDKAVKAKDSAFMEESFTATIAMAEVIAPGIKLPTFDRAAKAKDTFKTVCNLRRDALTRGLADEATSAIILDARGGKTLDAAGIKALDCAAVRSLFFGVGAAKKRDNNVATVDTSHRAVVKDLTLASLNKKNREKYAGK